MYTHTHTLKVCWCSHLIHLYFQLPKYWWPYLQSGDSVRAYGSVSSHSRAPPKAMHLWWRTYSVGSVGLEEKIPRKSAFQVFSDILTIRRKSVRCCSLKHLWSRWGFCKLNMGFKCCPPCGSVIFVDTATKWHMQRAVKSADFCLSTPIRVWPFPAVSIDTYVNEYINISQQYHFLLTHKEESAVGCTAHGPTPPS